MTDVADEQGGIRLRPYRPADRDAVLALNQRWVPHVGELDGDRLDAIVSECSLALVAVADDEDGAGGLAGVVLVLAPGAAYSSPNYRYFDERAAAVGPFRYVDRVAVGLPGHGVGRRLYDAVLSHAAEAGAVEVTCEVNLQPPNPDSQAFHAAMGFAEVGRQWTYDGTVEVQLLARPVPS